MKTTLTAAVDNLVSVLRETANKNTVAFHLFVNSEGFEVELKQRTAENLKTAGISMRNLKGEFIK